MTMSIRVLIIAGNGRAFSSGVDLTVLGGEKNPAAFRFYYRQNHMGFDNLESLEKPVIAAINGLCYGGGVELALSCDILFAADDAKFCLIENHIGCIPASGACNRMIHYVGLAKTKEMVISGEPIGADEAHRIGLVNHVVPAKDLLKDVNAYADNLATKAPFAMGMAKHCINLCLNTDMHTGRYHRTAWAERARALRGSQGGHECVLREAKAAVQGQVGRHDCKGIMPCCQFRTFCRAPAPCTRIAWRSGTASSV